MNCNDSMINNSILKKMNSPGRNFQILAISNRHLCNQPFEDQIKRVCEWHPDALVLREKDLPEDEYKTLAKNILDICKAYDVPCILHTYWKAALELGHDAIHLPLPLLRELSAESQKHLQSQNSTISQSFHVPLSFYFKNICAQIMILRAISSLMATRDSLILTMMFPPIAATTVAVPPGVKPRSSRCLRSSGLPPTRRIRFSSPTLASASGIMVFPPRSSVNSL